MRSVKIVISAILFLGVIGARAQTVAPPASVVMTCQQVTTTRPDVGVAYKGQVAIDDYKFAARIPSGLIGWGGVASDAPFHGFTIFLGPGVQSCILFEVHVRVNEDEAPLRLDSAKTFSLGEAKAWQTSTSSTVGTARLTNVKTSFSFKHGNQITDGEVLLISPSAELGKTRPIYEAFLRSIKFGQ